MQRNAKEFKELIFDLMNGSLDLENYSVAESEHVKDEFSKGSFCDEVYERVYRTNQRLCERLGVAEDKDVESIIYDLMCIGRHLALKMYDYGMLFSEA